MSKDEIIYGISPPLWLRICLVLMGVKALIKQSDHINIPTT